MDLSWIIVPAVEKHTIARYLVLGPVFLSSMSQQELDKALDSYDFATSSKYEYKTHLEDLPSIQYPAFLLYGKMLNRCLYPEVVDLMDFRIVSAKNVRVRPENRLSSEIVLDSSEGRADIEDLLLQQIRQGNPNFRNAIPALQLGQYGEMAPQSTLRQLKDECIVAITLSSRAAMDGGLSRQQALGVGDSTSARWSPPTPLRRSWASTSPWSATSSGGSTTNIYSSSTPCPSATAWTTWSSTLPSP